MQSSSSHQSHKMFYQAGNFYGSKKIESHAYFFGVLKKKIQPTKTIKFINLATDQVAHMLSKKILQLFFFLLILIKDIALIMYFKASALSALINSFMKNHPFFCLFDFNRVLNLKFVGESRINNKHTQTYPPPYNNN